VSKRPHWNKGLADTQTSKMVQRPIFFAAGWFLMRPFCVLPVVALRRLLNIYFYIVISSDLFGIISLNDWMCRQLFLLRWGITLFSLQLSEVLQRCVSPFYRLFGLQQRGRYGKKGTIGSSTVNNAQSYRWLIKSSRFLFSGWRRSFHHFTSIIMDGGLHPSLSWTLVNFVCFFLSPFGDRCKYCINYVSLGMSYARKNFLLW